MDGLESKWVQPKWWGPPDGWVGGVLPFNLVVAQSNSGVILAEDISVYPSGVSFSLRAFLRPSPPDRALPQAAPTEELSPGDRPAMKVGFIDAPELDQEEELPTDHIRFGAEFDDGRRAERDAPVGGPGNFSIRAFQEGEQVRPNPSSNVVLCFSNGGGSPESIHEVYFLWPLPPGELRFFGSWADGSIVEQRATIEASVLKEALSRAHRVQPD